MIRFEHAWVLWLHLLLPVLGWLAWREASRPRRLLAPWGGEATLARLLPGWSRGRALFRGLLAVGALAFWITAAAGPQIGTRQVEVKRKGVDVVVAVDVSQSMAAQDLAPDRMARARHSIRQLLANLKGDRVALLPFSGTAYLQHPLTSDYALSGLMTDLLKPGLLPMPGTDIGAAIRKALATYQETGPGQRVLIILSDGEDLVENWVEALGQAREAGVVIYTVGMGTPAGAPVPDPDRPGAYKLDRAGGIVLSRLDETVLQKLATEGGGLYLRSTAGGDELVRILDRVGRMEGRELGSRRYAGWQERYAAFLLPGLLLSLLAWWWPAARRAPASRARMPAPGAWLLLALLAAPRVMAADPATANNRGLRDYGKQDFGAAAQGFGRSLAARETPQARFNLGDALFRGGDLEGAAAQYRQVAAEGSGANALLAARAWANLGRVLLDQQRLEEAARALEEALVRRPDLAEARHNLELALRRQDSQQGKSKDGQDKQQQQGQDKQDSQGGQQQDQQGGQKQDQPGGQQGQGKEQQGEQGQGQQAQPQQGQGQAADSSGQAAQRIDPAQLQQLLNAVTAQEKQSMARQLQRQPDQKHPRVEKDW